MLSLANALCVLAYLCVIHILSAIFTRLSRSSEIKTQISGSPSDPSREITDDQCKVNEEILRSAPGFQSRCEEENSCIGPISFSSTSTSKYQFLAGNSFSGCIEELQTESFKVQELFSDADFHQDTAISKEFSPYQVHREDDDQAKTEEPIASREVFPHEEARQSEVVEAYCVHGDFPDFNDHQEPKIEEFAGSDISSPDKNVREVNEISSSNKDVREVDEIFSSNKRVREVEEISSSSKDALEGDTKVATDSSCLSSGDTKRDERGELEIFSENEQSEKEETLNSKDLSDHDFSVSSDSDSEDALEDDELISFGPDEPYEKARIVGLDDKFLKNFKFSDSSLEKYRSHSPYVGEEPSGSSTYGFSISNNHELGLGFDEVYSPQSVDAMLELQTSMSVDTYRRVDLEGESISRFDFSDSDDDELERSFVKGTGSTKTTGNDDDDWLKSYEYDDEEEESDLDVLLEHHTMVQKMKSEMRLSRVGLGLPTILEESASVKVDGDLKPLKIDEKIEHKDRMDEIQTFYRSYSEKMRRLDILCHQSMYAAGFMQMKNQNQPHTNRNLSIPSLKSLSGTNCCPQSLRRKASDPLQKLCKDLHRDLELVYVGQLCLSWEILKWQHCKSEELQPYDASDTRRYNQVAVEFQQFQVLVQRFTEDESFQGPRIPNYVKKRCVNSNILQVPLLKEDTKGQRKEEVEALISITKLKEIIEESIFSFGEFLRADKKDECILKIKSLQGVRSHLEDPSDAGLLNNLRSDLQRKERKLKGLVKSGNCIVRKFQKQHDFRLSHELLLAQVELRLVSRVLDLSRLTTDQLLWCHKKLSKIKFSGRKVHIETSFLLFPC